MHQTPTLLLVTENSSLKAWFKNLLDESYSIIHAQNRHQAVTTVLITQLQFIIIDSQINENAPFPLCHEIRNINTSIPIFLITGRFKQKYRDEALQAGVTDFLNAELNSEEVKLKLEEGIKAAQIRHKTKKLSTTIPLSFSPQSPSLTEQAVEQLSNAKKGGTFLQMMVIEFDHPPLNSISSLLEQLMQLIIPYLDPSITLIPTSEGRLILLLSDATPEQTYYKAEEILKKIEKHPFKGTHGYLNLTASIAISPVEGTEQAFTQIIQIAGRYLKKAKSTTNKIISLSKDFM